MIDEEAPQPCLKCGRPVSKAATGDPEARGGVFTADAGPEDWEGIPYHRQLEVTVCGSCLTEAGRAGRVILYAIPAGEPEASLWGPAGLRAV